MELVNLHKDINVLIVEDMKMDQLLLQNTLHYFGVNCDTAENGKIAIEKLKENNYDIVLMDLLMPEMDGFEASEYIRTSMKSTIPIIALSAEETPVTIEKCTAVGISDYITKPFNDILLFSTIFRLIKKHLLVKETEINNEDFLKIQHAKYSNLDYLKSRTKSNSELMIEMISIYLEQTPTLLATMKQGIRDNDWMLVHTAVHKIIPSFSIMGISVDYENMAKKIQELSVTEQQHKDIESLFLQIENACTHACKELEMELENIKNSVNEYHR